MEEWDVQAEEDREKGGSNGVVLRGGMKCGECGQNNSWGVWGRWKQWRGEMKGGMGVERAERTALDEKRGEGEGIDV